MWTRTSLSKDPISFQPNHFVPLIPSAGYRAPYSLKEDEFPSLQETSEVSKRRWYGDQAEKARDDDGVPKTSTHVLPFPNISKEWYSPIKKSSVNEAENCADQRVNIVPFVALSKSWYQRRSKLLVKNDSRKEITKTNGSLEQNIENLDKEVQSNSNPNVRKKCMLILNVGKYLLKNGPIVQARELGKVYVDKRNELYGGNSKRCPKPTESLATLSPYLNIEKIVLQNTAFFIENRNQDLNAVVRQVESLCQSVMRETMNAHLEGEMGLFKTALRF
ncbi:hypothetical protein OS493_010670 [Desmophyllum pertusum]|uniref:Uncharacterized protein n=1 Tax=Desmophyllum pertusum TaxID=174260 RepID=A0A9W9ZQY0_9CNID|nr:hypothetical protein OS493_010670 [Desmophyllum pertusum]